MAMHSFTITVARKAGKNLLHIDRDYQIRIKEIIDTLETNPVPQQFDVTKISGSVANYRIRVGDYRIQYTVNWNTKEINVHEIDRKKDRTYR